MAKSKREGEQDPVKLTTSAQVVALLRLRYPAPAWAFFENVGDGTGMHQRRWADGFAMSLWPSRGLVFHGFEVKVTRQDVMRELAAPEKADAVAKYCDYWWLAVGSASIVKLDEVPPAWGLLAPKTVRGATTLHVLKDASKLEPKDIDRKFTAAILRRAAEHFDVQKIRAQTREDVYSEVVAQVEKSAAAQHEYQLKGLHERLETTARDLDDANKRLAAALGNAYHSSVINGAIDFLRWLDGWSSGAKAVEHVHDGMLMQINRLQDAHAHLVGLRTLLQELHSRKGSQG